MRTPTTELNEEVRAVGEESTALVRTAAEIAIRSDSDYERAGEIGVELQTRIRRIEEFRDRQIEDWKDVRREALAAMRRLEQDYKPFLEPLVDAKEKLRRAMTAYRSEQERKRRIEAEKAAAEAAKKAEAERRKREKIAESLKKKGLEREAEEVVARAPVTVEPVAAYEPPTPKVRNVLAKKEKRARFDGPAQYQRLAKAVEQWNAAHPDEPVIPAQFWTLDEKAIQREVKRTNGMIAIPGCEFYDHEETMLRKR